MRYRLPGYIEGDAWVKRAKFSVHFLRKFQGWSCDNEWLRYAKSQGVKLVRIIEVEHGDIYEAGIEEFFSDHAIRHVLGINPQTCLPIWFWHKSKLGSL